MNATRTERGAVGTIVAILLAGGVIMGMLAMSVDVGRFMVERRQLQNGADAAAMSLALSCAKGNCVADADGLQALTDANAKDGDHGVSLQCARNATGTTLPQCANGSLAVADCPPLPPAYASMAGTLPYVEVRTQTRSAGQPYLVNVFSRAAGNTPQTTLNTCSRAAWGKPSGAQATTPITISICEWQTYTAAGTSWVVNGPVGAWPGYGGAGQPSYPPAPTSPNTPGHELVIGLHDVSKPPCSFNGKDTAGGFGYLEPTGSCAATVTTVAGTDQWSSIDTGSSATNPCKVYLANVWTNGPTIDIPVFDCIVRSTTGVPTGGIAGKDCTGASPGSGGAQSYYHIVGWAKFYLSGYKIGGSPDTEKRSRVTNTVPCTGSTRCLSGWFVKGVLSSAPSIVPGTGGIDLGSYAVVPLG